MLSRTPNLLPMQDFDRCFVAICKTVFNEKQIPYNELFIETDILKGNRNDRP